MSEWKESCDTPPHRVLLEFILSDFDPNEPYTLGYVHDGYSDDGDGEVRWYTLHRYLGRECDHAGPKWWRVCPNPRERIQSEIDECSRDWYSLIPSEVKG